MIAKADGLYRCNGKLEETKFAERGDILPHSSSECGHTGWELHAEDQIPDKDQLIVLVGQPGPDFAAIVMGEIPNIGMTLNLRSPSLSTKFAGAYRITQVDMMEWRGVDQVRIVVKEMGAFDDTKPIHRMNLLTYF